jgi:hypothetical protein
MPRERDGVRSGLARSTLRIGADQRESDVIARLPARLQTGGAGGASRVCAHALKHRSLNGCGCLRRRQRGHGAIMYSRFAP